MSDRCRFCMTPTPNGASFCPGCGRPQVAGVARPAGEATPIAVPLTTAVKLGFGFAFGAGLVVVAFWLSLGLFVAISLRL